VSHRPSPWQMPSTPRPSGRRTGVKSSLAVAKGRTTESTSRVGLRNLHQGSDYGIYIKDVVGSGSEELLLKTEGRSWPTSWSADGNFILLSVVNERSVANQTETLALPLSGEKRPIRLGLMDSGEFSPDGRWIAYVDYSFGNGQVFVRPFDPRHPGAQVPNWQISTSAGIALLPHWRGDGKELFYYGLTNTKIMAVSIRTAPTFEAGKPVTLFDSADRDIMHFSYDVAHDGQRFLVGRLLQDETRPVYVSLNWLAGVKK
jgi:eukaryotic-like serine/threonine-protein kinase